MKTENYLVVAVLLKIEKYFCHFRENISTLFSSFKTMQEDGAVFSLFWVFGLQIWQYQEEESRKVAVKERWSMFSLPSIFVLQIAGNFWKGTRTICQVG